MQPSISPLPSALSELVCQVRATGNLTVADRYGLLAFLLHSATTKEEREVIDRLLYSLRRNQVQVVDDLSALIIEPDSLL